MSIDAPRPSRLRRLLAAVAFAPRDAYRIVVNRSTRETWFTPDHYANFYKL
ncbi:hypothetical protein Aau02nite_12000 [Amorphoplanes auranticolor]|uniref:Uncharacterized protein n=1 Tax=Actinoplanes auranticolor TaxID=47988 RepID=A0A919S5W4_9ACTN|nr:hypothetical protein Aau02nite_12000 [Actinoplanes auranticolor]